MRSSPGPWGRAGPLFSRHFCGVGTTSGAPWTSEPLSVAGRVKRWVESSECSWQCSEFHSISCSFHN